MTLPDERYHALKQGKKLLEELCDNEKTKNKEICNGYVDAKNNYSKITNVRKYFILERTLHHHLDIANGHFHLIILMMREIIVFHIIFFMMGIMN